MCQKFLLLSGVMERLHLPQTVPEYRITHFELPIYLFLLHLTSMILKGEKTLSNNLELQNEGMKHSFIKHSIFVKVLVVLYTFMKTSMQGFTEFTR